MTINHKQATDNGKAKQAMQRPKPRPERLLNDEEKQAITDEVMKKLDGLLEDIGERNIIANLEIGDEVFYIDFSNEKVKEGKIVDFIEDPWTKGERVCVEQKGAGGWTYRETFHRRWIFSKKELRNPAWEAARYIKINNAAFYVRDYGPSV